MKSKFKVQKLGDIIREISVRNNTKAVNQVFSVTNSQGFVKSTDYFDKEVFSKNISNYKIVRPNQFAYNPSRINVGSIDFLRTDFEVAISPLYVVFECKKDLSADYLLRYLKSPVGNSQIRSKTRGAVRDNLTFGSLAEINIPIASIPEQRKIIKLLSKIEAVIAKRRESILLLDELLKSKFFRMFGDPIKNEKGWKIDMLENLVDKKCPLTYGIVQPGEEFPHGVPVVRPVDLTERYVSKKGLKTIDPNISNKFKRTILSGDELLICVRGTTGVISFATKELKGCNVTRGITPIWFDKNYNKLFAFNLLNSNSIQREIKKLTYGIALQQINLSSLRSLALINPLLKLQNEFASVAEEIESLKKHFDNSLKYFEAFYSAVSSLAFRGELDLSNIELDHIVPRGQGGSDVDGNVDLVTKIENKRTANKKGSILKIIVNKQFKTQPFSFEELAEKIQANLVEEEYDYNKIKNEVFASLKGNGEIKLKQIFNEKEKKILLQTDK